MAECLFKRRECDCKIEQTVRGARDYEAAGNFFNWSFVRSTWGRKCPYSPKDPPRPDRREQDKQ